MTDATGERIRTSKKGMWGWALYDWANSPYTTVIITFVFGTYFAKGIVGDEVRGQELWGYAASIAGLIIAIGSPVLGAIADAGGPRKPWLAVFTALCIIGSGMLWYAEPDPSFVHWAMFWVIISTVGFEFGIVFNNAMLPDLVAEERLGRWSGWAWGLGYLGGLSAMIIALLGFVQAETPLFGLDKENLEHIRVVGPLVAIWFLAFVWPMFMWTPDKEKSSAGLGEKVSTGFRQLGQTLKSLRHHRNVLRFLIARMIYADGLATMFAFGGIYAAGTFGMELTEVITFGIILNVTAGVGAICFAWIDDWIGSKPTIVFSLLGLTATAFGVIIVEDVSWFWVWGSLLGIFVGPSQAASRSMMARLAPAGHTTEFFGLYALTGKATAFIGPFCVAIVTASMDSQRWGMAVVLVFFVVGLGLLMTVRAPGKSGDAT
jgi:MFS transporter, UMF1 family